MICSGRVASVDQFVGVYDAKAKSLVVFNCFPLDEQLTVLFNSSISNLVRVVIYLRIKVLCGPV